MKVWTTAIAIAASGTILIASDPAQGAPRKRQAKSGSAATASAARQWGLLSSLAGTAWLDEKSGTITQYRWKLKNEILAIEINAKDALEPRIDEVRLAGDGSTLTRTIVQPAGLPRQFALDMPRAGMLVESDALGATVTRRTARVTGERIFTDSEVTLNGAPTGSSSSESRKLSPTSLATELGAIAAAQANKRAELAALEKTWGPLAKLVDTDWRWQSGETTFLTQYRWREAGKTIGASHVASKKSATYDETFTLDPATGAITGKSDGTAMTYTVEDGALVATAANNKTRTLRKPIGPDSYQLLTQKRKGDAWVLGENVRVETAMGGIPTMPIQLRPAPTQMAMTGPIQVAVPTNGPARGDRANGPAGAAPAPQDNVVVTAEKQEPKKKSKLFSTLMKVGGVAVALTGAGLVANALTQGLSASGAGGSSIGSSLTGSLGQGAQSLLGSAVNSSASSALGAVTGKSSSGTGSAGGSYAPRKNILEGQAACRGYTVDNYKSYFQSHSTGPDVQLHTLCAGAYNYYWMYLNAIRQGYSQADSNRTYDAFTGSAKVALDFYANAR